VALLTVLVTYTVCAPWKIQNLVLRYCRSDYGRRFNQLDHDRFCS